jgi:hypothetical protein
MAATIKYFEDYMFKGNNIFHYFCTPENYGQNLERLCAGPKLVQGACKTGQGI